MREEVGVSLEVRLRPIAKAAGNNVHRHPICEHQRRRSVPESVHRPDGNLGSLSMLGDWSPR